MSKLVFNMLRISFRGQSQLAIWNLFCLIVRFGVVSLVLLAAGCSPEERSDPEIVGQVEAYPVRPAVRKASAYPSSRKVGFGDYETGWIPAGNIEKKWTAIVIHHSATDGGNAEVFDDWHRNGHKWMGIGYDFVIGNGKGSRDGSVEVTFRWKQQITGAHVGGTPGNWANRDAVGICLVGDFTKREPTRQQMESLAKLVRFLQKRYKIPSDRIYGHSTTPGYTGKTICPGKYFSFWKLKKML